MRGERTAINRQTTDQRLDIRVVRSTLALRLRDGGDLRDQSIKIVVYLFGIGIKKAGLGVAVGGDVSENWCDCVRRIIRLVCGRCLRYSTTPHQCLTPG